MLQYTYLTSPKIGDLVGVVRSYVIIPAIISGFGKAGNIQVIHLNNRHWAVKFKEGDQYYKTGHPIPKNRLGAVVSIDIQYLSAEQLAIYNFLVKNVPLP